MLHPSILKLQCTSEDVLLALEFQKQNPKIRFVRYIQNRGWVFHN